MNGSCLYDGIMFINDIASKEKNANLYSLIVLLLFDNFIYMYFEPTCIFKRKQYFKFGRYMSPLKPWSNLRIGMWQSSGRPSKLDNHLDMTSAVYRGC